MTTTVSSQDTLSVNPHTLEFALKTAGYPSFVLPVHWLTNGLTNETQRKICALVDDRKEGIKEISPKNIEGVIQLVQTEIKSVLG